MINQGRASATLETRPGSRGQADIDHRAVDDEMMSAYALHEILCDEHGDPVDYRFIEVNHAFEELTGLKAEELILRRVREIMPDIDDDWISRYGAVALEGVPIRFQKYSDELQKCYECVAFCPRTGLFAVIFVDVTAQKTAEEWSIFSTEALEILNRWEGEQRGIDELLELIRIYLDADAAALRLRRDNDYPYFASAGFTDSFREQENFLCTGSADDTQVVPECLCGAVISGNVDPTKPYYSEGGSFWINSLAQFRESVGQMSDADMALARGACIGEGYESFALIPVRCQDGVRGLLQVCIRTKGKLTAGLVSSLETLAGSIGIAVAREEARMETRKLTAGINCASDAIMMASMDGRITYVNTSAQKLLGRDASALQGAKVQDLEVGGEISSDVMAVLEEKGHWAGERRCKVAGGEMIPLFLSLTMVRDNSGHPIAMMGVFRDIADQKLAEQQKEQLLRSDKLASLETLVSGVAHEINNPANFITLNSPILQSAWRSVMPILDRHRESEGAFDVAGISYDEMKEFIPTLLGAMNDGARRIKQIIMDLKNYARAGDDQQNGLIDVNTAVKSALSLAGNQVRKSTGEFTEEYSRYLPLARGNTQRLEQVIISLIQNACESLESRADRLSVRTRYIDTDRKICIEIEDSGRGMSDEELRRAADPFYTTKRDTGGTGLGLSVSTGIVKGMGGTLSISSKPGMGTSVSVELPECMHV